jgi:hypothetical protein
MRRLTGLCLALALSLGALAPQPAAALGDKEKKAIAAALALGLAVAAAKHAKGQDAGWDETLHGKPFRPAPGVVCLPRPRKCYEDGHLSWRWTRRVFG